ncbi:MAG: mechanosensitive ion channel [Cyclobacteriaceae bacterium]
MDIINFLKETDSLTMQMILTGVLLVIYWVLIKIASRLIRRYGNRNEISLPRIVYTTKYFRFILMTVFLVFLGFIWDISFEGLSVYFISFFTVAGIGLFASWSILSNLTAAIILFFYFPYKIGDHVKIVDGENSIEGMIFNLNMFSMIIQNAEGQKVTYPNNLALQKAIILLK